MLINEFEKLSLKKFKIKSIMPDATILCLGKRRCLAKGTKVLMYDGSLKNVEDIHQMDAVMGDDSTPRTVLDLSHGTDAMYSVTHTSDGSSYTVNSQHILSLEWTKDNQLLDNESSSEYVVRWFDSEDLQYHSKRFPYTHVSKINTLLKAESFADTLAEANKIDIPISKYLELSSEVQQHLVGYQAPVTFPSKDIPFDPYVVAYLAGQDTSSLVLATSNARILRHFAYNMVTYDMYLDYIPSIGYTFKHVSHKGLAREKYLGTVVQSNKHSISSVYKVNTKHVRSQVLAGIIDSFTCKGAVRARGRDLSLTGVQASLQEDLMYLARSLGVACKLEDGEVVIERSKSIPSRCWEPVVEGTVTSLTSPIRVESVGFGEYYGFLLDGNHRFMLGNFVVTHNSGKSWLVRDIFYNHRHIPTGVVFSGTEEASPFFSDFIPDSFIHSEYDPELIEGMMNRQKRKIREAKYNGRSDTGKAASNNVFIVLDDMLHDAQNWKKDKTIKNIFFNGRHYNFLFILTMQYPLGITPELRSNIDYVFVFNEPSVKNRKKIYDDYAGMIPSFDHFCNILDACTQNHECLVIKTSGNSTDLREQIFWYKAESHSNFRVGHHKLWNYHKNNYNEQYENEADIDQMEIDKLKRKFAKTKKLKVIVSRQGEIVGYKHESE